MKKKLFKTFDIRGNYLLHLFLIMVTLFIFYFIGDAILNFDNSPIIKMFIWFLIVFYFADNLWEKILGV